MLKKDIYNAQIIVSGNAQKRTTETFHQHSFIYKTTNENFKLYKHWYEDKDKILTVEGSGDQILNAIAMGATKITAFDISSFPRYFSDLKLCALLTLKQEEFEQFFYQLSTYDQEFNDEIFFKIAQNIKDINLNNHSFNQSILFWESLFNFFDGYDIYNSPLFSSEFYSYSSVKTKNLFIEHINYNRLKSLILNVQINHIVDNITNLVTDSKDKYDLINLSNIIDYPLDESNKVSLDKYKSLLQSLPLNNGGIALTYLFYLTEKRKKYLQKYFNEKSFSIEQFENQQQGVLIYKK